MGSALGRRLGRRRGRSFHWGPFVAALALAVSLPVVAESATGSAGKIVISGAFSSSCDGKGAQICLVDATTHAVTAIPNTGPGSQEPTVTKDGKRIAFVIVGAGSASLQVMNRDGSGLQTVVSGYAQINHPSLSPDGKSIAFAGEQNSGGKIVLTVVRADGTDPRILGDPTDVPFASEPTWSPNGQWIAFVSMPDPDTMASSTNPSGIYEVHPDGTGWHRVEPVTTSLDQDPSWSPNGAWLAFTRLPVSWKTSHISSLYRMNANGTGARRLTSGFWDGGPVISPDGTQIAFYRYRGTNIDPHTYTVSSSGGPARRILAIEATPSAWLKH